VSNPQTTERKKRDCTECPLKFDDEILWEKKNVLKILIPRSSRSGFEQRLRDFVLAQWNRTCRVRVQTVSKFQFGTEERLTGMKI